MALEQGQRERCRSFPDGQRAQRCAIHSRMGPTNAMSASPRAIEPKSRSLPMPRLRASSIDG